MRLVAHEHAADVVRNVEPLVKVERDRVRVLDAAEQMPKSRGHDERRAERAVHVQPERLAPSRCVTSASRSSIAPVFTVPAVAMMQIGRLPAARSSAIARSSAAGMIR